MEFGLIHVYDLECLHKESLAAHLSILSVSPETKYETCNHFQHILNCSSIIISAMHGFCCEVHSHCTFSAHFTHSSYTSTSIYQYVEEYSIKHEHKQPQILDFI